MKKLSRVFLSVFGVLLIAACSSRPAAIGVDANYIVEVTNSFNHPMTISANLGAAQMAVLGEVGAGQTKRFEIRDPSTNDIELVASSADNSHRVTRKVELERGVVSRVQFD